MEDNKLSRQVCISQSKWDYRRQFAGSDMAAGASSG